MSELKTDLSRSPYFDDFKAGKQFHQVLFKPSVAVQTRELNTTQSIMQDQITKFGRQIFKDGSVVEGCSFTFDNNYNYVKIKDNFANNSAIPNISDFNGRLAINPNGLVGRIVATTSGYESQNPALNTLYVKYINSTLNLSGNTQTTYSNNETLVISSDPISIAFNANTSVVNNSVVISSAGAYSVNDKVTYNTSTGNTVLAGLSNNGLYYIQSANSSAVSLSLTKNGTLISIVSGLTETGHYLTPLIGVISGNVIVSSLANSTGKGYAFNTTEGVIFKKGYFINVIPQSIIVSAYNNVPDNISVGFQAIENIITPEIDTSLLDNAAGSPNFSAPGANRLQLVPTLTLRKSNDTSNSASFFSLCDFQNGYPISIKNDPQYAALGKELAQRTFETNGDYIVNPFLLSVSNKSANVVNFPNYLNLVSSSGIGYVRGYRVEFINNTTVDIRKGLDYESISNQIVSANYGYYLNVNEFCGDFNNQNIGQIEFHSVPKTAVSTHINLAVGYSSSTKIGTAYCRGVAFSSGNPGNDAVYRLYLFNIKMLPGHSINEVKSVINYSTGVVGVTDVVLIFDSTLNAYVAKLQDSANETMIHPFGQKAIKPDGFTNTQYVYRNRANASFLTSGQMTLTLSAAMGTATEQFYNQGLYSSTQEGSFIVIPLVDGFSVNKTGTVSATSGSNLIVGSSSTFLSDYSVGEDIYINGESKRIIAINSNISMVTDLNYISSASGVSHQSHYPAGVPINFQNISNRTISATSTVATLSLGETISASFQASVYFDILRSSSVPIKKKYNTQSLVRINVSNNAGGTAGPWCLGMPDVIKLNNVYVSNGTFANTNTDLRNSFYIDNGQRDSFYGPAYLYSTNPISNSATILVSLDNYTTDTSQGVGYFTANSYPIDDVNTANTTAVQTAQLPQYTSINFGTVYDLRDCVDFRPYVSNTAVSNTTIISSSTINPSNTLTFVVSGGSYLPSPDSAFQSTIQHYLPRIDRIALTTTGNILITEGISSNLPSAPQEIPGTMTIGVAKIPAYPSLIPSDAKLFARYDYSVQITIQQTKRYTMGDIGKISNRIDRLEYYTSLSLLEQSAQSLSVRSNATGQNRFKNGILVDPFRDHSIGNTNDSNYRISIDPSKNEARPYFATIKVSMNFDPVSSTNTVKTGQIISLPFTTQLNQQQSYASKYRNCIEGNIYNYRGSIILDPPGTIEPDVTVGPDVVSNLDLSSNWINLQKYISTAWGTSWGAWTTLDTSQTSTTSDPSLTSSAQNADGTITNNYQSKTTTTTTQKTQSIGQQLTAQPSTTQVSIGNFVTNISILPYIKSAIVFFKGTGLKPNTKLYAYFNSVPVTNRCVAIYPYTGTYTSNNGINVDGSGNAVISDSANVIYIVKSNTWGYPVQADSTGTVYGVFALPDSTFRAGEIEFKLTDISNLTQGESAVSTQATGTFYASSLSIKKSNAILNVRSNKLNSEEVTQNNSIQQTAVSYTDFSTTIASPAPYIPFNNGNSGGWDGSIVGGAGGDTTGGSSGGPNLGEFVGIDNQGGGSNGLR